MLQCISLRLVNKLSSPVGIFVYLIYLFFVVVVLLSLLVAQMSDTFASIQSDADRVSIMIRATTILTQERKSLFGIVSV